MKGLLIFLEQNPWVVLLAKFCFCTINLSGRRISAEIPIRYLCVRFWHVLHKKHLTCLRATKLALWTHLSHSLHRYALSAGQYNEACKPHSSQEVEQPLVAENDEEICWGGKLLHEPPRCFSSTPLHILRSL